MTYHQISPVFLDFVFSFGHQEYPEDFYLSGIRLEQNLDATGEVKSISTLQRSDRGFQLCYNLRSVETTTSPKRWPWSIRQSAISSQYDVRTSRATWIILKANKKLRVKLQDAAQSARFTDSDRFDTVKGSFAAYLATHVIVCEWARGHWARYITFLEGELQRRTRFAALTDVDKPVIQGTTSMRLDRRMAMPIQPIQRQTIWQSTKQSIGKARTVLSWRPSRTAAAAEPDVELDDAASVASEAPPATEDFTFDALQELHSLEERSHKAVLSIQLNMSIMKELREHIFALATMTHFPDDLRRNKCTMIDGFAAQILSIMNDLKLQEARLRTLLQLLGNRKAMVSNTAHIEHIFG
jgi:hypothetical protein